MYARQRRNDPGRGVRRDISNCQNDEFSGNERNLRTVRREVFFGRKRQKKYFVQCVIFEHLSFVCFAQKNKRPPIELPFFAL